MLQRAVHETDWRDRSPASVLLWSAVSLALHLIVTQLPAWFHMEAAREPAQSAALSTALASEIPVELLPESETPKVPPTAAFPPREPEAPKADPARAQTAPVPDQPGPVPTGRTALPASEALSTGGANGVDTESSNAGAGGASGADAELSTGGAGGTSGADTEPSDAARVFAGLEPSPPGARLLFDPFRTIRDRSSGGMRMLIDSARLRRHPLGVRVGELLAHVDASDVLGPSGIDPIRDAQRIFVYAPELADASGLILMIQHRNARARLDARLERFVVPRASGLWVVAPESLLKSVERMPSLAALPSTPPPSVVWAHIETPWRAFLDTPISVPRSLRWAEVRIAPDGDGMIVRIEAEDEDERSAPLNARQLAAALSNALGQLRKVEFHATNAIIVGTCRFTEAQLDALVERVRVDGAVNEIERRLTHSRVRGH